jgi:hypothetical protein
MRSTNILIFLVALNASAVVLGAAGVSQSVGYDPNIGGDAQIESANESVGDVNTNKGSGFDTFVGAVISAASTLTDVFGIVIAGPTMLINLGAPGFIVYPLATPLYLLVGIDILQIISGRDLT